MLSIIRALLPILVFALLVAVVVSARRRRVGVRSSLTGHAGRRQKSQGVLMVRDPHCGRFVDPGQALTASAGTELLSFCSTAFRDGYTRSHGTKAIGARSPPGTPSHWT